jgi:hypothetical protein
MNISQYIRRLHITDEYIVTFVGTDKYNLLHYIPWAFHWLTDEVMLHLSVLFINPWVLTNGRQGYA